MNLTSAELTEILAKGAAVYTPLALALYDLAVLGLSNSFVWQCSSHVLLDFYNQHVSDTHLDIGVGTEDCTVRFTSSQPRKIRKAPASLQSVLLYGQRSSAHQYRNVWI
jgi:hypothetical protein